MALLFCLAAAQVAVRSVPQGDTMLYHLNVVRWNNEYPVVPGLGNLHQRFGVSSTWLLYGSLWDVGTADGRSAWFTSGLVLVLVLAQWMAVLLVRTGRDALPQKVYALLTLPYLLENVEFLSPSLYYDKQPLLALMAIGMVLLETPWLRKAGVERGELDAGKWRAWGLWLVSTATLAFTFKASSALALAMVAGGVSWSWWRERGVVGLKFADLAKVAALGVVLLLVYCVTNVFVTGWPLFPAPVMGFPVPWAQPVEDVRGFYALISDWARLPGQVAEVREGFWNWWPTWAKGFSKSLEYILALGSLAGGLCLLRWGHDRRNRWAAWGIAWMLGMAAVSAAFWMATAPDLRFGDGLFHLWFGLTTALALSIFVRNARSQLCIACVMALGLVAWLQPVLMPRVKCYLWTVHRARANALESVGGINGLPKIWVPTAEAKSEVGDSPLPATPVLNPALRQRDPEDLGAGFYLEPKKE